MLNLRVGVTCAVVAASMSIAVLASGCGDDGGYGGNGDAEGDGVSAPAGQATYTSGTSGRTPLAGGAEASGDVDVTLREYEIITAPFAIPAGETVFQIQNAGPNDEHEFVVIRTDLNPEKLPTTDDGSVSLDDLDVVDEVGAIGVGDTVELTVELTAGAYVFICNVVEEEAGATESHYQNGMRESFRVD